MSPVPEQKNPLHPPHPVLGIVDIGRVGSEVGRGQWDGSVGTESREWSSSAGRGINHLCYDWCDLHLSRGTLQALGLGTGQLHCFLYAFIWLPFGGAWGLFCFLGFRGLCF